MASISIHFGPILLTSRLRASSSCFDHGSSEEKVLVSSYFALEAAIINGLLLSVYFI